MSRGKTDAQAGHAFCSSLLNFIENEDGALGLLRAEPVTRVVLVAKGLSRLERARDLASGLGLPCALFTDSGHVEPPDFDGSPVVTALGIGPCRRGAARSVTKGFRTLS